MRFKRLRRARVALALMLVALTLGCAGIGAGHAARERALLPALRSAWAGVDQDLERGIRDGWEDGELTDVDAALLEHDAEVLDSGLREGLDAAIEVAPRWIGLDPWAHRGVQDRVDDGEIVAAAGESGHERVRNFARDLLKLEE